MKWTIPFRLLAIGCSLVILFSLLLLSLPFLAYTSQAQEVPPAEPITPSGLNTQVSPPIIAGSGPTQTTQYNITGGTRPGGASGTNLFHSFGDFSVPTNNIANFLNLGSVDLNGNVLTPNLPTFNILGRVTGGDPSVIFGMIQTNGPNGFGNANLFLMNPHGFLFGPNATVNVGGMMTFTTADYLRLQDIDGGNAGIFRVDPLQASLLTSAPVAAFGFIGRNPGAIIVQGSQLTVSESQNISLVGGDITIEDGMLGPDKVQAAQLSAPGGSIYLASAKAAGEFVAGTLDQAPNVNGQSFENLGAIQISQKSVLDTSGDGGGTVLIRGGRFLLDDSTISANTIGPEVGPLVGQPGTGVDIQVADDVVMENGATVETNVGKNVAPGIGSGGVRVKADRIKILGFVDFETETFLLTTIRSDVAAGSTGGSSGDISLEGDSILINAGNLQTQVGVDEFDATERGGAGNAGNIIVTANQSLDLDFATIASVSCCDASGNAGNIELTSINGNISSTNFSNVTTQARDNGGNAGRITVSAPHGDIRLNFTDIFNQTFQAGALGGIEFTANNLTLLGESSIGGDNLSPLLPGNIELTLSGSLNLRDNSFIRTVARGPRPAANLIISAGDISISGDSFLTTETNSSGPGGELIISTESLQLATGGQLKSGSIAGRVPGGPVVPSGAGGTITIQGLTGPAASVLIDGTGSGIFTNTKGIGPGGSMNISTQSLTIQNGGTLSASTNGLAPSATGGLITVTATDHVAMTSGASITTSSIDPDNPNAGLAKAGDISIIAGQQFDMRDSSVTAEAKQASGGNIDIRAVDRIRLVNSEISSSVQGDAFTASGNITIDPNMVVLLNSQVIAKAVQGAGGNITIFTPLFLADSISQVDASSQRGVNGTVTIQSPNAPASGQIQPLDKSPLQATSLLNQRCASLAGGEFSSFTVAGRDSLPTEPDSWLASPLATLNAGMGLGVKAEGERSVAQGEGEPPLLSLRQIAPAGFLTQAFAVDWSASCQS